MRYEYTIFDLRVPTVPNATATEAWMERLLAKVGTQILGTMRKEFPSPVSGEPAYTQVWVLSESHAVVHTTPEDKWIEVTFAFCKDVARPPLADSVKRYFKPEAMNVHTYTGVVPGRGFKKAPSSMSGLGAHPALKWPDNANGEQIIYRTKSPYQEIELARLNDGEVALHLDGNVQFVSGDDDMVYHWSLATLPALMMDGRPFKALIMGGGDGLAARNLFEFPNVEKVTMVELDPGMADFARDHPIMRKLNKDSMYHPKMDLRVMDARKFVAARPTERYDIAVIDFTDPLDTSMNDLFSVPFYQSLLGHMNASHAVLAAQSSSAYSSIEQRVMDNMAAATKTGSFPVRFFGEWMADGTIVFSGRGAKPKYADLLPERHRALQPKKKLVGQRYAHDSIF